jgi:starch-binding outer membrane protein, SusD/RagB family
MHTRVLQRVLLIPALALGAACDDILELNPHDTLSPEGAWRTESDARLALTGAYARMYADDRSWPGSSTYFNGRIYSTGAMTDDAYTPHNHFGEREVVLGNIRPTTGGIVTNFYHSAYRAIGTFNDFLANVDMVQTSAAQLNQWKAEVRFLRAFYYSHLSELYGGVPVVTRPYKLGDPLISRGTKDDVVKLVLEDLDFAIANLPSKRYDDGHVVQATAQALEARVLLANKRYAESAALSRQIIDSKMWSLYTGEYKKLFEAAAEANNPELMFSVGYKSPNLEHDATRATLWWNSSQPTQDLVDAFEMIDGNPITTSPLYDPQRPYENRDPRLKATVLVPGERMANEIWWVTYFGQANVTRYNLLKPADRAHWGVEGEGEHSENDVILIRYAEVLLNYAEAQNEAVGPDASVYAAVTEVRSRAGMPNLPPGLGQAEMRTRIRSERRVELAFEAMHRYLDIVRWRVGVQEIDGLQAGTGVTYRFADHNHLWPIPQSEIDYYRGHGVAITQNPGY